MDFEVLLKLQDKAVELAMSKDPANAVPNRDFKYEKILCTLVVKECARIADIERDKSAGCGYITKTKGEEILEHFGVDNE